MGNKQTAFTEQEMQDYEELTYLTKKDILLAWTKWEEMVGGRASPNKAERYDANVLLNLSELQCNPFKHRICHVFSSEQDSRVSFEDFLDLLSVMSKEAPLQLKAHYAFRIFDYNDDGTLDEEDLAQVVDSLTGDVEALLPEQKKHLVDRLLQETDLDGGGVSMEEFKHLLTKCSDFVHSFRFSI